MDRPEELTDIQRYYKNSTVFLTGATGFIGKLVLEKILRALPVKKVYILVRKKKNDSAVKRVQDILESPAFDGLKRNNPDALKKICLMEGDCSSPMLGLSQVDQNIIIEDVDVIFHVAASIRFDDPIKKLTLTNIRSTKDLIALAQQNKKLKVFVYVGTGFSNCNQSEIKEQIYPAKISAEKLISACESLDDDCLNSMTNILINGWPNTYTFTKQVTEEYINRIARDLPICILRPAIVISTSAEPLAAFVDNVFTLAGFVVGKAVGIVRIDYYKNTDLDVVPVDFVVNQCIAVGWQTGVSYKSIKNEVPVYNITSCRDNPISQDRLTNLCDYYCRQIPSEKVIMFPLYFRTTCKYNYLFCRMLFHTLLAYILDLILWFKGKKPMYAEAMAKLHKFQETYQFFETRNFFFHVENTHRLLKKMSFKDRELFNFDVTTLNWETYFIQYTKGIRFYLLKDDISTIPQGTRHMTYLRRLFIFVLIVTAIVLYVTGKIVLFRIVPVIFRIVRYSLQRTVC